MNADPRYAHLSEQQFMSYCFWLFETREMQPLPLDVNRLLRQVLEDYLKRREDGQMYETLESAFGLKSRH